MHNLSGIKDSAQIAIHQAELGREEKVIDQKILSISNLRIDYLNFDNSVRNNKRATFTQSMCSHFGGSYPNEKCFKQQ